ncbi:hypothetical protein [Lacrimispora sp. 210928-DFI.3.58]|uniref:hypothetical protein n=1 Tax=Lacrimispora sp. 210928-DFI.3.58 TaxID=2883214 RepID=UPI001D0769CF|nr:hypothetical protein [Lacrimispora sp. 210928-DFI.3.58]MCB7320471.1 hypothetical protein [Lacrimispora sp. 210928-DFI.3.58]
MYMMFNNFEKGWSLGLLYDNPAIPDHLQIMLQNREHLVVHDLAAWLAIHNVQAIAYCTGGWKEKLKSYRFIRQFNHHMEKKGMLADLGDFYYEVMVAEKRAV